MTDPSATTARTVANITGAFIGLDQRLPANSPILTSLQEVGGQRIRNVNEFTQRRAARMIALGAENRLGTYELAYGGTERAREVMGRTGWRPLYVQGDGAGRGVIDETYARRHEAIAVTEQSLAAQHGTHGRCREGGLTHVRIADGPDCGWRNHDDEDKANGTLRTLEEAADYPLSHPRCRRTSIPATERRRLQEPGQVAAEPPTPPTLPVDDVLARERSEIASLRELVGDGRDRSEAEYREIGQRMGAILDRATVPHLKRLTARRAGIDRRFAAAQAESEMALAALDLHLQQDARDLFASRTAREVRFGGRKRLVGFDTEVFDRGNRYSLVEGELAIDRLVVASNRAVQQTVNAATRLRAHDARASQVLRAQFSRTMGRVRPMGGVDPGGSGNRVLRARMREASVAYPRAWLERIATEESKLHLIVRKRGYASPTVGRLKGARGRYVVAGNVDEGAAELVSTMVHEIGHHVEFVYPRLARAEGELWERRRAGGRVTWLGRGYDRSEEGLTAGVFPHRYMGKVYRGKQYTRELWELLTMGMESLAGDARGRAGQTDREVNNLILGLMVAI